jgi:hypothetical protein
MNLVVDMGFFVLMGSAVYGKKMEKNCGHPLAPHHLAQADWQMRSCRPQRSANEFRGSVQIILMLP